MRAAARSALRGEHLGDHSALGDPAAGAGVSATVSTLCQTEEISAGMYKSVVEVLDEVCSVINCNAIQGGKSEWSVRATRAIKK